MTKKNEPYNHDDNKMEKKKKNKKHILMHDCQNKETG